MCSTSVGHPADINSELPRACSCIHRRSSRCGRASASLHHLFVIYTAANIGLVLQNSLAALLILRLLQSPGSSGTIPLSSGVVSNVAMASERGKLVGLVLPGSLFGPSIEPVIRGLLGQCLGWRAVFWFLVIFSGVVLVPFLIFFPEIGMYL